MTEVELEPTGMVAGGSALARDGDGRVVFVEGALPGERVRARVTEARKDFAKAVTVDVLEPSPDRVRPPCAALAAGCGGCTWQHVSPEAQVRLKAGIVFDALRRIARLDDPPVPQPVALAGPPLRTTAELAASLEGRAGHRPRRGRGAVETETCLTAHPLLEELIVDGRYPGATEVLLRVAVATGERMVVVDRGRHRVRVPADVVVVGRDDRGRAFVHETVGGRRFRLSAASFFQPGPVAAEALASAVASAVGGVSRLVDAYAGVGVLGGVVAPCHLVAVESDPSAVADARVNLADLDAEVVHSEMARWRPRPADAVIADPSRPGLGRPGVAALAATGAGRLVLVSCDPASFARDTALLAGCGFRLRSVALVDAFPHTFHVETVSRFDR